MSYDFKFTKGKDKFIEFLLGLGGKQFDNQVLMDADSPLHIGFTIEEGILFFNYLRNHLNVEYAYLQISTALMMGVDFAIQDLQTGKTYSLNDPDEIIDMKNAIKTYVTTNTASASLMNNDNVKIENSIGATIPIKLSSFDPISRDIFYQEEYNADSEVKELGFIPKPFVRVNGSRDFHTLITWTDFIDQSFPTDYNFEFIMIINSLNQTTDIYKWNELKQLLPPPQEVQLGGRKRHFYHDIDDEQMTKEVNKLKKSPLQTGFIVDDSLSNFFPIIDQEGEYNIPTYF